MPAERGDAFAEYRLLILQGLERLNTEVVALNIKLDAFRNEDISQLKVEVAMLKVRASMIGALAGIAGSAIVTLLMRAFRTG